MKKKCEIGVLFSSYVVNNVMFSKVLYLLICFNSARRASGGAGGMDHLAAQSTTDPENLVAPMSRLISAIALNSLLINFLLNNCLIRSLDVHSFLGLHSEL